MGPIGLSVFQKVRDLLDVNGFREPLPPEGILLARHLIEDLIIKKNELKEATSSLKECKEKCEALNVSLEPFKEENGRLLTKLNQLHMENLKLREQNGKLAKDKENATRQLQIDKKDLEFLVGELKRRVSELEEESSKKSDKILQLQEKNLKAVVVTPGGTRRPVAFQRQRMEISSHLDNMTTNSNHCPTCGCGNESIRSKNKDLYIADLLRMSDRKLMSLQRDVETHKENATHWEDTCSELRIKIDNRDKEIARLQLLLEGGRPISAILEDNKLMTLHSQLHQLKLQNDLLAKTNSKLDLKLKSVLGDTHEAMNIAMAMEDANKDLTAELQTATSTNRILKKDVVNTKESLTMKLARNKEKLEDCEGDLVEQHSLYHETRDQRDELKRELTQMSRIHSCIKEELSHLKEETCHLSESNACLKEERHRLEEILKRGQGERKAMADRINTLTVQLQELEMERLSLQTEVANLRSNIASLEKEKTELSTSQNFFKKEVEKLTEQKRELELEKAYIRGEMVKLQGTKEQLDGEKVGLLGQIKELEDQKASAEEEKDYFIADVTKYKEKLENLRIQELKLKNKLSEMDDEKESITKERDHYNEQVVQLLDILKVKPSSTSTQVSKSKLKPEEELPKVAYERDVLKQELNFYKTQLRSLQTQMQRMKNKQRDEVKYISPFLETERGERVRTKDAKDQKEESEDEDIEALKGERNFLREQMEHFQHLYNESKMKLMQWKTASASAIPPGARSRGSPSSPPLANGKESPELRQIRHELRVCDQEKEFFREQYERLKISLSKPLSPSAVDTSDVESLIRERNVLREERDFYKIQYDDLSAKISESALAPTASSSGGRKQDVENIMAEKRAIALSKAQLEAQLINLRDDMADLERDNQELIAANKELTKTVDSLQNATVQKLPPSMQNFIGEIRKSRDAALDEVEKLKQDRDALRAKIKLLSAQQIKDRSSAQEDYSAFEMQKAETETKTVDLEHRIKAQASLIVSLQNQTTALQEALQQAQAELGMSAKQSEQFRMQLERKSGEANNQGQELEMRSNQLSTALVNIHDLESEVAKLQQDIAKLEAEGKVLKGNLGKIDSDKDALSNELDSKAEFIETLKIELKKRSAEIAGLEAQVTKMQQRIESCEMTIDTEQRKVSEETKRCDRFQQDLAVATEQKDAAVRECRRLQKEVVGLTEDINELKAELERTRACRENFKRKAQEYCRTLEHLSTAITNRDKEQDDLMQQYLNLNEAISSLKSLNASLEESATNQTMEITKMENVIHSFKEERENILSQVNEALTKNEALEEKCHHLEEAKFNLERDLLTTRDLNQKVEMRRSEADNEARRLGLTLEKLLEEKRSLEHQLEAATAQLSSERSAFRSLEEVLSEKRKTEFLSDSAIKQLEVERSQLQRKISEINAELESESTEMKRLRSRISCIELDLERAKRQLTNEQYERERAEQELRRVRKYSSMRGALAALGEVDTLTTGKKLPKCLDTPPAVSSYSPSLNGAVGLPQRETPPALSPSYFKGVTRQPYEVVASPCAAGGKISSYDSFISSPVGHTDYPKVGTVGEGSESWKFSMPDHRIESVTKVYQSRELEEADFEKKAPSEYSPLNQSNIFPSKFQNVPRPTTLSLFTSPPPHCSSLSRSTHSVSQSRKSNNPHSLVTPSSTHTTTGTLIHGVSPSTYKISSPPTTQNSLSFQKSKSVSTRSRVPSLSQVGPEHHQASSLNSSYNGTKVLYESSFKSQTITISDSSSSSTNNPSHSTSHTHSPFHAVSPLTTGPPTRALGQMKASSLPQTPVPKPQPHVISQSLQNLQSLIKPSAIPSKTFYSSFVPDIPVQQSMESNHSKGGTPPTDNSSGKAPSLDSPLEFRSQHSNDR